ncbi:MAG: DUF262 domain-containing protein [Deltaproteobacteria bacterium]|nr:DUF262 domain-containing protein [Deltaproteobacteria bacterium]
MKSKIQTVNKKISAVLKDISAGKYAIPRLQREFVWDGSRAAKLMDSIYKEMPIGSVLVWNTPTSKKLFFREKYNVLPPFNDRNKRVWFLIDGQQRLSVLHGIYQGMSIPNSKGKEINFRNIVFSLDCKKKEQCFSYRKPQQGRFVSLNDILSPQFKNNFYGLKKSHLKTIKKCRESIFNYKILQVVTSIPSLAEVKECFLRINTQGIKVSSADAIFSKAQTLDLRDFVHETRQKLGEPYKNIDDMPILWTLIALRGVTYPGKNKIDGVVKEIENEATKNPSVKKNIHKEWSILKECFKKAVIYLENNFRVINLSYLYSPYMISMLALFYYFNNKHNPDWKQKDQIRKWFWSTTTAGRYSGKAFYKCIVDDASFFKKLSHNNDSKFKPSEFADVYDIRKTQYNSPSSGMGSAFYCLLLRKKPVSLLDESLNEIPLERYLSQVSKDRHHIFPRALLSRAGFQHSEYNSICNICLLTSEENKLIGNIRPSHYLKVTKKNRSLFARKMSHHIIPFDSKNGLWMKDIKKGFRRFVRERQNLIKQSLEKEAGIRIFRE